MEWQRLSQRSSGAKSDGPYEGVPGHLIHGVVYWFQGVSGYRSTNGMAGNRLRELAVLLRVDVPIQWDSADIMHGLIAKAEQDGEFCLDLMDASLRVWGPNLNNSQQLQKNLSAAASVWTVADDKVSLSRVVGEHSQATYANAVSVRDEAADELSTAWSNAFGRNGDPSDAWDHAIKAVEDVLTQVVVPNKQKPTLGDVVGVLNAPQSSSQWEMILPGHDKSHAVAPLVAMLRLMWPNHDRHGGAPKRPPSESEARAVVTLAATIVQWHRQGWVVRRK